MSQYKKKKLRLKFWTGGTKYFFRFQYALNATET